MTDPTSPTVWKVHHREASNNEKVAAEKTSSNQAPQKKTDFLSLLLEQSSQLSSSPVKATGEYLHLPSYVRPSEEGGSDGVSSNVNGDDDSAKNTNTRDAGTNVAATGSADVKAAPRDPFRHIPRSLVKRRILDASRPRDPIYELDHPTPSPTDKQRNQQQVLGVLMHKKPHRVGALTVDKSQPLRVSPLQLLVDSRNERPSDLPTTVVAPPQQLAPIVPPVMVADVKKEKVEEGDSTTTSLTSSRTEEKNTLRTPHRVYFSAPEEESAKRSKLSRHDDDGKVVDQPLSSRQSNTEDDGGKVPSQGGEAHQKSSELIDGLRTLVEKYTSTATTQLSGSSSDDILVTEIVKDVTKVVDKTAPGELASTPSFERTDSLSASSSVGSIHRGLGGLETSSSHFLKRGGASNQASLASPFVSQLVKKCISPSSSPEAPVFVHWRGMVAVLFIDMSGYSKLTTALAPFGAHALSEVINSYMDKILAVVDEHNGDVLKFAGDAIMVAWPSGNERNDIRGALTCALALQDRCGSHYVPQVNHTLHLHIGCVYGNLTSHVSLDAANKNMPRAYHAVSGPIFRHIGTVVDTAKSGEVCVDRETAERAARIMASIETRRHRDRIRQQRRRKVQERGGKYSKRNDMDKQQRDEQRLLELQSFKLWETDDRQVMLVERDAYDPEAFQDDKIEDSDSDESSISSVSDDDDHHHFDIKQIGSDHSNKDNSGEVVENLEEILDRVYPMFLHPSLLLRLSSVSHVTHVMEMRFVVVLFIRMNDDSTFVVSDWFSQVLAVLEASNCPAVQLIEDDKGVHIVAAINLYTSVLEPIEQAVKTASLLVRQELGCTIGVAAGTAFCGVIGSTTSSRWDIAAECAVRACRLMQHAQNCDNVECVFDGSIYERCKNLSLIMELGTATVKGTSEPVKVYTLNSSAGGGESQASWMIASDGNRCDDLYANESQWLMDNIVNSARCCAVAVIDGPVQSGKLVLAIRAISRAHIDDTSAFSQTLGGTAPLIHVAHPDGKPLELALTISSWFQHSLIPQIAHLAREIAISYERGETGKVIRLLRELVNESVNAKFRIAFIVKHAHFLDSISLSFVRYLVEKGLPSSSSMVSSPTLSPQKQGAPRQIDTRSIQQQQLAKGKFIVILTTAPVYGAQSASAIVGTLLSQVNNDLPPSSPLTTLASGTSSSYANLNNCTMAAQTLARIKLVPLSEEESGQLIKFRLGWNVGRELSRLICRKSGAVPGFIDGFITMIQAQRPYITHLNISGYVRVQPHQNLRMRNMPWTMVAPMTTTSLLRLYDELPARHKVLLRLVAALTQRVGESFSLGVIHQVFKRVMKNKDNIFFSLLQKLVDLRLVTIQDVGLQYAVAAKLISQHDADVFLKQRQALQRVSQFWLNDHSPEEDMSLSTIHISLPPLRDALALTLLPHHTVDLSRQACIACGDLAVEIAGRTFTSNPVVRQRHQQFLLSHVGLMKARVESASNKESDAQRTLSDLVEVAHRNLNQTTNTSSINGSGDRRQLNQDGAESRDSLVEMLRRQGGANNDTSKISSNASSGMSVNISAVVTEGNMWARLIDSAGVELFEFKWREHVANCVKESSTGPKVDPHERWVEMYGEGFDLPDDIKNGSGKNTTTTATNNTSESTIDPEANLSVDKISLNIVVVKNYIAPLALGNLGGHLMDAGMALREMYTAAVRSSESRASPEILCLAIGRYLDESERFAKFLDYEGPYSLDSMKGEKELLLEVCCTPRDACDVQTACESLAKYWNTTVAARKEFLEANASRLACKALVMIPQSAHHSGGADVLLRLKAAVAVILTNEENTANMAAARRSTVTAATLASSHSTNNLWGSHSVAMNGSTSSEEHPTPDQILERVVQQFLLINQSKDAFTADTQHQTSLSGDVFAKGSAPPTPSSQPPTKTISTKSFEKALLVLAQAPWAPRHKRHNLEYIRDSCLRFRTETFNGLLCSLIVHIVHIACTCE